MKLLDPEDPIFRRPWVRWAVVLAPLIWAAVEFWSGAAIWGVVFLAAGLYAGWVLFVKSR